MKSSDFTFKHEEDNLNLALGLKEGTLDTIGEKVINMVRAFEAEDEAADVEEPSISISKIVEKMINTFSDTEIVVLASIQVKESIMEVERKSMQRKMLGSDLPPEIAELFASLKKKRDTDPDSDPDSN